MGVGQIGLTPTVADESRGAVIATALARPVWAVVGASNAPAKWGHRVYLALRGRGYRVSPINPRAKEVAGDRCYPALAALPERPDVVSIILPPKLGLAVADEAAALGIARRRQSPAGPWFQPGAASPENVAHARDLGLTVVDDAGVLVELARHR